MATAQMSSTDSLFLQKTVNQTVAAYHAAIGDGSALFNGPKYSDYPKIKDGGHAFFNTVTPSKCSIVYDKVLYPNVNLVYDEVTGVVVLQDATRRIQLETDKITQFTIWDNRFTRLAKDSTETATLSGGFYQILYDGNTRLFKQETKRIQEDIRSASDGIIRSILIKNTYFIQKKGVYYQVSNKKDALSLFNDKKKEVAQYLKRNKLDFEKDIDNALVKIIAFYDALITNN
jgi:hypothetical protein